MEPETNFGIEKFSFTDFNKGGTVEKKTGIRPKKNKAKENQLKKLLQELVSITEKCDSVCRDARFGRYDLALNDKEKEELKKLIPPFQEKVSQFWYNSEERKKMVEIDF